MKLNVNTIKGITAATPTFKNALGAELGQPCKAFIAFNGSTGVVNSNFNMPSITKDGTGNYRANITPGTFATATFSIAGTSVMLPTSTFNPHRRGLGVGAISTSVVYCSTGYVTESASTYEDMMVSVVLFGHG